MPRSVFQLPPFSALHGVYAIALAAIVFWPTPVDRGFDDALAGTLRRLHGWGVPQWVNYPLVELVANIALFVPCGFLLAKLIFGSRLIATLCVCTLVSVGFELVQSTMLSERFASLQDVLANSLGAAAGALIYRLVERVNRSRMVAGSALSFGPNNPVDLTR